MYRSLVAKIYGFVALFIKKNVAVFYLFIFCCRLENSESGGGFKLCGWFFFFPLCM